MADQAPAFGTSVRPEDKPEPAFAKPKSAIDKAKSAIDKLPTEWKIDGGKPEEAVQYMAVAWQLLLDSKAWEQANALLEVGNAMFGKAFMTKLGVLLTGRTTRLQGVRWGFGRWQYDRPAEGCRCPASGCAVMKREDGYEIETHIGPAEETGGSACLP